MLADVEVTAPFNPAAHSHTHAHTHIHTHTHAHIHTHTHAHTHTHTHTHTCLQAQDVLADVEVMAPFNPAAHSHHTPYRNDVWPLPPPTF